MGMVFIGISAWHNGWGQRLRAVEKL